MSPLSPLFFILLIWARFISIYIKGIKQWGPWGQWGRPLFYPAEANRNRIHPDRGASLCHAADVC